MTCFKRAVRDVPEMHDQPVERIIYGDTRHPAIVAIGQSVQTTARTGFVRHRHSCTEVCLILGGTINYFTGNEHYQLRPDSLQINQPQQWHGTTNEILNPCTLAWMQLETTALAEPELCRAVREMPYRLNQGARKLYPHFQEMMRELRRPKADTRPALDAHLKLLLVNLARIARENPSSRSPEPLSKALDLIERHDPAIDEKLTVAALAAELGVHRSYLHQLFIRHTGISPKAYLREKLLGRAAELLTRGHISITEIAFQLGYSSTQHFATSFRKQYGVTPTAFRRKSFL